MITIHGVGPSRSSFSSNDANHSSSGRILSLAVAATDPSRVYAGSFAGVWRSDDAGHTWRQLAGPLTDTAGPGVFGSVYAPHVIDLAVSPVDRDVVLAVAQGGRFVTSRDGVYRSRNGGVSWELALPLAGASQVVFAPDDPELAYAALGFSGVGSSHDGGRTWQVTFVGASIWHVAAAPAEAGGRRRIYGAGDNQIWHSTDSGATWRADTGVATIQAARQVVSNLKIACETAQGVEFPSGIGGFAGRTGEGAGNAAQILAVDPGDPAKVFLATTFAADGPSFYNRNGVPPDGTLCNTVCERLAGEASLWHGDFGQFEATGMARWEQVPGPPVYTGVSTPSGNTYVVTQATSTGSLVFFSDNSHVHVAQGTPTSPASWHRVDGKDLSATHLDGQHRNVVFVHVDPHALIVSPDFDITLTPATGVEPPFDQNSVLAQHLGGTIWMANDGGVYVSHDGGQVWQPTVGLETVDPVNLAGLFGLGNAPALYFGCGDNDDFFTLDGGTTWGDPISGCGDCDAWFADVAQPDRVLELTPRSDVADVKGSVNLIISPDPSKYPNPSVSAQNHFIPAPRFGVKDKARADLPAYPTSFFVLRGYRPLIRTLATEAPLPDGDYVFIDFKDETTAFVLRTRALSSISQLSDWDDPAKAEPVGTKLPAGANVVQASGGHRNPVFYVANANGGNVWRWDAGGGIWKPIVPGGPPGQSASFALSFFVDPFRPNVIYLVDVSGIKVSLDFGESWLPEPGLTLAMTAAGKLRSPSRTVICDMLFSRGESRTRFAFGDAGVHGTVNGFEWFPLLDAIAVPGLPESGFFDPISHPFDRALYVSLEGRSILRIGGLPDPPPFDQPPVYDLMEFAAIIEA
jgi:hypothetical protein